jgi:hypothetical protein
MWIKWIRGSYLIFKKNVFFFFQITCHPVVLHRNIYTYFTSQIAMRYHLFQALMVVPEHTKMSRIRLPVLTFNQRSNKILKRVNKRHVKCIFQYLWICLFRKHCTHQHRKLKAFQYPKPYHNITSQNWLLLVNFAVKLGHLQSNSDLVWLLIEQEKQKQDEWLSTVNTILTMTKSVSSKTCSIARDTG